MCGIIAYKGRSRQLKELLINNLKKLQYRGYDSAGIAISDGEDVRYWKRVGSVENLEQLLRRTTPTGIAGIGHVRWATHGAVNLQNTHPIVHPIFKVAVVHNGVVKNAEEIKRQLREEGITLYSETDTSAITLLLSKYIKEGNTLHTSVKLAMEVLQGKFSFVAMSAVGEVVAVQHGRPLVIGHNIDGYFCSSDLSTFGGLVDKFYLMEEEQIISLDGDIEVRWQKVGKLDISKRVTTTLEEIKQQKDLKIDSNVSIPNTIPKRLRIIACGSSYYAGLIGKYYFESIAELPTEVLVASESLIARNQESLDLYISQSGETADILDNISPHPWWKMCVTNNRNSTLARRCDYITSLDCGKEYGVAATKTFTGTLAKLLRLAYELKNYKCPFEHLHLEKVLTAELEAQVKALAVEIKDSKGILFIGRGINVPIALEGALKMKEIAYIHSTGYPAGELKHGPLALVDKGCPVIAIVTGEDNRNRMISNCEEVKARGGNLIVITDDPTDLHGIASTIIEVPKVDKLLSPIVNVIPLQLLAVFVGEALGYNVNQPRNLAKCVTVE